MMINPMLEMALEAQKNAIDEATKAYKRMFAAPQVVKAYANVDVGATPKDVILEHPTFRLFHYRPEKPVAYAEPVLICYALVNRAYILDLQHNRSVVRQLLAKGLEVYLIDWRPPTPMDRNLRLYNYVCEYLKTAIDAVRKKSGAEKINLLGYCMGGAMSSMYTALHPEHIKNLTLLAAPIDFSGKDNMLHLWNDEKHFDVDALIDTFGNAPATFLQSSFQLMKPVTNYVEKYVGFFDNLTDEAFLANFFAMEAWGNDNIPVAGETFREFVKCFYQRNQLVKGEFRLNGEPIDLSRITCPLLLLAASEDHLVRPSSTFGIEPHVSSKDVKKMVINAGHVGLVVSSKAHKTFWPEAAQWIADRSTPKGRH